MANNRVVDVHSSQRTKVEKRLLKSSGTSQPLKISPEMKENSNFPVSVRPSLLQQLKSFFDTTQNLGTFVRDMRTKFVNIAHRPHSGKETVVPKQAKAMRS